MTYAELSKYESQRFSAFNVCPLCGHEIERDENFEKVIVKDGRYKLYVFLHAKCVRKVVANGKKEKVYC